MLFPFIELYSIYNTFKMGRNCPSIDVVATNVNRLGWYIVGNQFVSHRRQRQVGIVGREVAQGIIRGHPLFVTSISGSRNGKGFFFFFYIRQYNNEEKGYFKIHRRPQLKHTSVNCIVEFLNPLKSTLAYILKVIIAMYCNVHSGLFFIQNNLLFFMKKKQNNIINNIKQVVK